MGKDFLEKLNKLSPAKQKEVEDFLNFLLSNTQQNTDKVSAEIAVQREEAMGRMKGQIWVSDDFNDTPEEFSDYI